MPRTACAAHNLTMLVIDPRDHRRHEVPAEYFDQRTFADLEFGSGYFRGCEKSELVAVDPLFKLVFPFRGWVHGFIEGDFRQWRGNADIGPLAGPRMRRIFYIGSSDGPAPKPIDAAGQRGLISHQRSSGDERLRTQTKREAVAAWIVDRYSGGIPPGTTAKMIARGFEQAKRIPVDVRTVRRALGRK